MSSVRPALLLLLGLLFVGCGGRTGSKAPAQTHFELPPGVRAAGEVYICEKDGMEMVLVPAGPFYMGDDAGALEERPVHEVSLDAYLIDRTEVTNAQFARFVRESGYQPKGPWERGAGRGLNGHPVRFVTWHDAQAYARWAGRCLPTEAQWEKAARGVQSLRYPWGNTFDAGVARVERATGAGPAQVGSFPQGASPYGCLDMGGNVWEWVADWYDRRAYRSRAETTSNPTGPEDGAPPEQRFVDSDTAAGNERSTRKVIKGGGWVAAGAENTRAAKRVWGNPKYWLNDTGFRCALSLVK